MSKNFVNEIVGGDGLKKYSIAKDSTTGLSTIIKAYTPEVEGSKWGAAEANLLCGLNDDDTPFLKVVPQTRKINNKPLSTDINLTFSDVRALSASGTAVNSVKLNGKDESALSVNYANNAGAAQYSDNSLKWNGAKLVVCPEASRGTDAYTVYFCY